MAGVGVWWWSYSFDFPVEDFAFRLWRDVEPGGRWLKLHRPAKAGFKLADWTIHYHDGRAIIHPNDSRKFSVVADDITGPEPVGVGFTGQPDDAEKFRLVFVVGDSLDVSHKLLGVEIAISSETGKIRPSDYHMINHFNFKKLAGAN